MNSLVHNLRDAAAGTGDLVLIVDDVPDNLAVLHDALDESGYTVLVATNGEQALARVRRPLREQAGQFHAGQLGTRAAQPRCGPVVRVENAAGFLVHHENGIGRTVEEQAVAFFRAADTCKDVLRQAQPEQGRQSGHAQHQEEKHSPQP